MSATAGRELAVGSRTSALALRQTELAVAAIAAAHPGLTCRVVTFSTRGDRDLDRPLPAIGGKGVFTAELEGALRSGAIALAVHSLKDLPTEAAAGLVVGAVLERAEAGDALISRTGRPLADLPPNPAIGTSSTRRAAQILALRPDARILDLRGNVETRVRKAQAPDGPYDAVVLAAAGLVRLGLAAAITERLDPARLLPAPGQGAIALQCRAGGETSSLLAAVNHAGTWAAVRAERAFLAGLGGGCTAPVAAFARAAGRGDGGEGGEGDTLELLGLVASPDGRRRLRLTREGPAVEPEALGRALADEALERGAADLIALAH